MRFIGLQLMTRMINTIVVTTGMAVVTAGMIWPTPMFPASPAPPAQRVIDGSVNPESIPDCRAFSMFFRIIANRTGQERAAIRAYLDQIGLTGEQCTACNVGPTQAESQIDAVFSIGQEFHDRAATIDRSGSTSLREEKEGLCTEFVDSLTARLGPVDAQKVRDHVERMKQKMTITEH